MESNKIIPKGILFPFILLTTLFFAWAVPNNLTDTMLAAFKRIMSMSDSKTAWIQVVCYLLGYGCCAVPGALFIKKYTYKSGVMLGLGLYAFGAFPVLFLMRPQHFCSLTAMFIHTRVLKMYLKLSKTELWILDCCRLRILPLVLWLKYMILS